MASSITTKTIFVQVVTDTQITQAVIPAGKEVSSLREELHRKVEEIADQIGSLR